MAVEQCRLPPGRCPRLGFGRFKPPIDHTPHAVHMLPSNLTHMTLALSISTWGCIEGVSNREPDLHILPHDISRTTASLRIHIAHVLLTVFRDAIVQLKPGEDK
jgi:hypothetical protein